MAQYQSVTVNKHRRRRSLRRHAHKKVWLALSGTEIAIRQSLIAGQLGWFSPQRKCGVVAKCNDLSPRRRNELFFWWLWAIAPKR